MWWATPAEYEATGQVDGRSNEALEIHRALGQRGIWLSPSGVPSTRPGGLSLERLLADGWRYVQPGHEGDPPPPPAYPTGWGIAGSR